MQTFNMRTRSAKINEKMPPTPRNPCNARIAMSQYELTRTTAGVIISNNVESIIYSAMGRRTPNRNDTWPEMKGDTS